MTARRAASRRRGGRPRGRLRVFWTRRALADLEAIGAYIARDDPGAAERWIGRLVAVAERVAFVPLAGRRGPELERGDAREVLVRTYRVVDRVSGERVDILTVFEGHRGLRDPIR